MAVKYNFKADITFHADDMDGAILSLEKHFGRMISVYLESNNGVVLDMNGWFSGKMELSDDSGERIICEGQE